MRGVLGRALVLQQLSAGLAPRGLELLEHQGKAESRAHPSEAAELAGAGAPGADASALAAAAELHRAARAARAALGDLEAGAEPAGGGRAALEATALEAAALEATALEAGREVVLEVASRGAAPRAEAGPGARAAPKAAVLLEQQRLWKREQREQQRQWTRAADAQEEIPGYGLGEVVPLCLAAVVALACCAKQCWDQRAAARLADEAAVLKENKQEAQNALEQAQKREIDARKAAEQKDEEDGDAPAGAAAVLAVSRLKKGGKKQNKLAMQQDNLMANAFKAKIPGSSAKKGNANKLLSAAKKEGGKMKGLALVSAAVKEQHTQGP